MSSLLRSSVNAGITVFEIMLNTLHLILHPSSQNERLDALRCELVGHRPKDDCFTFKDGRVMCWCTRCGENIEK